MKNGAFDLPSPFFLLSLIFFFLLYSRISCDPQTNLLIYACSQYNATNAAAFYGNINATFSDLRSQLRSAHFAVGQRARVSDPVYALAMCRNYLATADCLRCFDAAVVLIRNCSAANGARVALDGCFLRYESNNFFDQTDQPGHKGFCGNQTLSKEKGFNLTAEGLLKDLVAATPKIEGFFAAVRTEEAGEPVVYGVAQCAPTASEVGCGECLKVLFGDIEMCPPDADGTAVDAGCFLRYSATAFFSSNQSLDLAPFLKSGSSGKKKAIIGGAAGGGAALLLLLLLLVCLYRSKKSKKPQKGDILGATELRGPVNFHYKDLKSATRNFRDENKLGEGGFGDVYKGVLKNGKTVAVKKLILGDSRRVKSDFESEVKLISNVHHRNLVRLLGCCSRGPQLILVYEFMPNGSLDNFLFGGKRGTLNWKQRFDIIIGMARGLAYLHEEFHVCIIHRDIKASNILLDGDFQAKIADFGLARLLPENQSHLSTKFAGTLGYTAPEYAIHGQLSEKVDMFSFGVVMLEIISGRKSVDTKQEPAAQFLLEWAWNLYEKDMLIELVDPQLEEKEYRIEEMKKIIEVALCCTQSSVAERPTMSEVVVLLVSKVGRSQQTPSRPIFVDSTQRVREDAQTSSSSMSNATMSVTHHSGR